jgi:dephospho-CoA kinase
MIAIGITGSIASGKSTFAQLIAKNKYPLFSADKIVSDLYKKKKFSKMLAKKFNLSSKKKIKVQIKLIVNENKNKLKILESIIHPFVRKGMNKFLKKKNKIVIFEIPLLIENKLNKHFNKIVFVDTKKKSRLKRYLKKNGDKNIFNILNKRQLSSIVKKKICDVVVNNNYSLAILEKSAKKFIENYE